MNKDLIQQAAEKYSKREAGQINFKWAVEYFLSYAKSNGYELLRVDENELLVEIANKNSPYAGNVSEKGFTNAIKQALAIGAAKERERMKGVFEKASDEGWHWDDNANHWHRINKQMVSGYEYKTTEEIINNYKNKEG